MILLCLLLIIACLSYQGCRQQGEPIVEESAVIKLLDDESRHAVEGNLDSLLSLYVQDGKNARLSVTRNAGTLLTGWEAIRAHQENLLESEWMDWKEKIFRKENIWMKIHDDNAWAVCDNIWQWRDGDRHKRFQNIQITICEKHDGRWKIAFLAFVRDPEHPDVIDLP